MLKAYRSSAWRAYRWARRIAVSVVGFTVVLIGLLMIALPGPAVVVIPIGLAILGLEYAWARRWLRKAREESARAMNSIGGKFGRGSRRS